MFGFMEIKPASFSILGKRINLIVGEAGIVYRRDEVSVIIGGKGKLGVLPAPAIGYGVRFLMVKLKPSLAVPPSSTLRGYLKAPVDVEVVLEGTEIDRFIPCREKYALYGENNVGVIARYTVSSFYPYKPHSFCSLVPLIIKNETSSWFHLRRLVFPMGNSPMFYRGEEAYYPQMLVNLRRTVEVVNTGNPPDGTLKRAGASKSVLTFRMRWL